MSMRQITPSASVTYARDATVPTSPGKTAGVLTSGEWKIRLLVESR